MGACPAERYRSSAAAAGLRVVATVRTGDKAEFCRRQGADEVVDLSKENLTEAVRWLTDGNGVDIVYDTVGAPLVKPALEAMAIGGRYIIIGFAGGSSFEAIEPLQIQIKGISVTGALHSIRTVEERQEGIATLGRLYTEGKISMPINKVFPFADVPDAIERLGGSVSGKLIVSVSNRNA